MINSNEKIYCADTVGNEEMLKRDIAETEAEGYKHYGNIHRKDMAEYHKKGFIFRAPQAENISSAKLMTYQSIGIYKKQKTT